ncbi:unnamed protein product, partial [Phaeothamnion confervicola]
GGVGGGNSGSGARRISRGHSVPRLSRSASIGGGVLSDSNSGGSASPSKSWRAPLSGGDLRPVAEEGEAGERLPERWITVYRRVKAIPWVTDGGGGSGSGGGGGVGSSGVGAPSSRGRITEWFDLFDKNRDGTISFQEFRQTMDELRLNLSGGDLQCLMDRFETRERDGKIDRHEFLAFVDAGMRGSGATASVHRSAAATGAAGEAAPGSAAA